MSPTAPGHPLLARMVIRDEHGRVLLVRSAGRTRRWGLPGGIVEASEPPRSAAEREVREELGLNVTAGALVAADWAPARTPGRRARLTLIFTGPRLGEAEAARIVLQPTEVDAVEWATPDRVAQLLSRPVDVLTAPRTFTRYTETTPETL